MQSLADELRRAVTLRAIETQARIEELQGRLGKSSTPLEHLLGVLSAFPDRLRGFLAQECDRNPDPADQIPILRPLLIHATSVRDFVDSWLGTAELQEVPLSLVAGIGRVCDALGIQTREPIVCVGPANNFTTVVADIENIVFDKVGGVPSPGSPRFAVVRVPRFEGLNVLWHPVLLGHELGHLAVDELNALAQLRLVTMFDFAAALSIGDVPGATRGLPGATRLLEIANSWAVELLCDAFAVHTFGTAAVASLSEFLEAIGATDFLNDSHPPGRLRNALMTRWQSPVPEPRVEAVAEPWRELATQPISYPTAQWAQFLVDLFMAHADDLMSVVTSWPTEPYDDSLRSDIALSASDQLSSGRPIDITVSAGGRRHEVIPSDVVLASWVCRVEGCELPFSRLARKALDNLEFVRRWCEAQGSLPVPEGPFDENALASEPPVLSSEDLRRRVYWEGSQRLHLTPLLPGFASGTGIDLRLGNQFIVFTRTRTASFDPLVADDDPRVMQRFIELRWGETFILHPRELVLACTLEYMVLPSDLTAQVITRSSYGRLGLLSATAVQVHPHFHGCLTLELANLGTIPIVLTPGERITQLVVSRTASTPPESRDKYRYPTGPEFSKVRSDPELQILRQF